MIKFRNAEKLNVLAKGNNIKNMVSGGKTSDCFRLQMKNSETTLFRGTYSLFSVLQTSLIFLLESIELPLHFTTQYSENMY